MDTPSFPSHPPLHPYHYNPSSLDFSPFGELRLDQAGKTDGIRQKLSVTVNLVSQRQAELDLHISSVCSSSLLFVASRAFPVQYGRFSYGTLHVDCLRECVTSTPLPSGDIADIIAMCANALNAIEGEAFTRYCRRHDHKRRWERLTPRERDVLVHMRNGFDEREIATLLCISPNTVATHRQRIYEKMGVSSPLKAIAAGTEAGYFLYLS